MTSSFEPFVVVVDKQEKDALPFPPTVSTMRADLKTGDYTVRGMETIVAVERKSPADFVNTLFGFHRDADGRKRPNVERFAWELVRLEKFRHAFIAVTGSREDVARAACEHADTVMAWTGKRYPPNADAVWSLAASLSAEYIIPIICYKSQAEAAYFVERALFAWWKQERFGSHVSKYRETFASSGKAKFANV